MTDNATTTHLLTGARHAAMAAAYRTCAHVAQAEAQHVLAERFNQYAREAYQRAATCYTEAELCDLADSMVRKANAIPPQGWGVVQS